MPFITCVELDYPDGAYVEGGDVVCCVRRHGPCFLIGHGNGRTTLAGAEIMAAEIQHTKSNALTLPVALRPGTPWYHLDTCVLPLPDVLVVAEPLDALFEEASALALARMWPHRIVLADHAPSREWLEAACNAVVVPLGDGGVRVVTTVPWPEAVVARVRAACPGAVVVCPAPTELVVGGGGVACAALVDDERTLLLTVAPDQCDLYRHALNPMQARRHARPDTPRSGHAQRLVRDMAAVRRALCGMDTVVLQSRRDVPECVYVKDAGVLLREGGGEYTLLLGRLRAPERAAEAAWMLGALEDPAQHTGCERQPWPAAAAP